MLLGLPPDGVFLFVRLRHGCTSRCKPLTCFWELNPRRPGQGPNQGLGGGRRLPFVLEVAGDASTVESRADSTATCNSKADLPPSLWDGEEGAWALPGLSLDVHTLRKATVWCCFLAESHRPRRRLSREPGPGRGAHSWQGYSVALTSSLPPAG